MSAIEREASEPHEPPRTHDKTQLARYYHQMLAIRRMEEALAKAYALRKFGGFLHLYIGQEAVARRRPRRAQARRLRHRHLPRARPRVRQGDAGARRSSPSSTARRPAARRASAARCTCSTPPSNFLGGYGIVGGHIPLAAGAAFASKYRGDGRVTLCFFGDGSVPQGAFHEGVALAALWRLPVVFICENNLYSMGTPLYRSLSVADVSQKALGYGIARDRFDGDDVIRVRDRVAEAVRRARNESLPTLIEIHHLPLPRPLDVRRRPLPHQGRGRGVEEARPDAVRRASCSVRAKMDEKDIVAIEQKVSRRDRRGRAVRRGEPRAGLRAPRRVHVQGVTRPMPRTVALSRGAQRGHGRGDGADDRIFLMGEEVGHYDGAYKVSQGMLKQFGEKRVIDTPIAEGGFVGVGIGAAMVGPAADHRADDLELLARRRRSAHQQRGQDPPDVGRAVHAAGRVPRPGRRGAHAGARSTAVDRGAVGAHPRASRSSCRPTPKDAKGLLKSAIRDDNPIVFIEGEVLYADQGEIPDGEYTIPLGVAEVKRPGTDFTIIGWSKMVKIALATAEALAAEGIEAEVVDPRTIRPLDEELHRPVGVARPTAA